MNKRMVAAIGAWLSCGAGFLTLGCSEQSAVVGGNETDGSGGQSPASVADQGSVKRTATRISGRPGLCLPFELPLDANGAAACKIFAAKPNNAAGCACDAANRAHAPDEARNTVRDLAKDALLCDEPGAPACADYCVCEDLPAADSELSACLGSDEANLDGWCYVSPDVGIGTLDAPCDTDPQAKIRFLGSALFTEEEEGFMVCSQASAAQAKARPLGSVCVPSDERNPSFSGFALDEVVVDAASNECASGVCVVQQFQGRVSCPFGSLAGAGACLLPDSNERVAVEVRPQLVARGPSVAATCSCRCAGPGDGPFCGCGDGLECVPLVADLGLPGDGEAGSYCLPKRASEPWENIETCLDSPEQCGDR